MFRNQGQSGGVTVKPVDTTIGVGIPLLDGVLLHLVCKGVLVVVHRRVDGQKSWLIDGKDVLVFPTDRKGYGCWKDGWVGSFRSKADGQHISCAQSFGNIRPHAVFLDALRCLFEVDDDLMGVAVFL